VSISVKLATAAIAALVLSTSFAQAAQVNNTNTSTMSRAVALGCSAGHGDVAQTITITNSTGASIAKGTKISWSLNSSKGSQTLDKALGAGKTISDLAPPGNGGVCKAWYLK
jgi:hypothetical protein